ncbi:bifunctional adenosylcobinamide kinase/adenosylcobinamide-phosphate guanylyltransferase [Streptomyces sp. SL13]|uniref:Adenosylcobinamide kinase n=1 Tax=Streptantibioticus silvisoli TaxID=2705255 RepID=A0AA90KG58_9ACTN|nr:bifunctional adenosylcobinamide kinase/adenosylcobinamide-phosphate guanylyltransferase [Streptantibioticus silvisoli]MDI5970170.1 bifunctional adenosylcobinamide kinase/adenosylcobinamide-phosphate guanylyltransferase [Streptantibioticus silvisoli]
MEITLLGTGAPPGLPVSGCPCAACAAAAGPGARAPSSVLVDDTLLIDLAPGPALAAARAGRSLHGVRQVLLSHPLAAPAVDLPPGLPAPGRMPDGEELTLLTGHRVRALAADAPGTGYAVSGADGGRLLYLPAGCGPAGRSPLPAGRGVPYDMVLMDVVRRPDALARLRADGAVGPTTDVVAVHLGHDAPPAPETRRRLAAMGARAVPDGRTLTVGVYEAVPDVPRRTLVLGAVRSGRSAEAERRLAAFPGVTRWTARDGPGAGPGPDGGPAGLLRADGPPLLVAGLGRWLERAVAGCGGADEERWRAGGGRRLAALTGEVVAAWRATPRTVVAVSDEAGAGSAPDTVAGRRYRDALGTLNGALAAESDHVLLMVAGMAVPLR